MDVSQLRDLATIEKSDGVVALPVAPRVSSMLSVLVEGAWGSDRGELVVELQPVVSVAPMATAGAQGTAKARVVGVAAEQDGAGGLKQSRGGRGETRCGRRS